VRIDGIHGADIVCGEGQPLGVPLAAGGPYFGFMATRMQYVAANAGGVAGCNSTRSPTKTPSKHCAPATQTSSGWKC